MTFADSRLFTLDRLSTFYSLSTLDFLLSTLDFLLSTLDFLLSTLDLLLSTLDFYSRLSTFTLDSRLLLSTFYSRLSTFYSRLSTFTLDSRLLLSTFTLDSRPILSTLDPRLLDTLGLNLLYADIPGIYSNGLTTATIKFSIVPRRRRCSSAENNAGRT